MRKIMKKSAILVLLLTLLSAGAAMSVQVQEVKADTEGKSSKVILKKVTSAANKVTLQNTKGKNASDVAAIRKLLKKLKAQDYDVSKYEYLDFEGYSWSKNGKLTELRIDELGINDLGSALRGRIVVKGFKNLIQLNCDTILAELEISKCPKLRYVYCCENSLKKLEISRCYRLEMLDCGENRLTELDVSQCPELKILDCWGNNLTKIDVSGCHKLERLTCAYNYGTLTELDVSKCPKLIFLSADPGVTIPGWHFRSSFGWKRN